MTGGLVRGFYNHLTVTVNGKRLRHWLKRFIKANDSLLPLNVIVSD